MSMYCDFPVEDDNVLFTTFEVKSEPAYEWKMFESEALLACHDEVLDDTFESDLADLTSSSFSLSDSTQLLPAPSRSRHPSPPVDPKHPRRSKRAPTLLSTSVVFGGGSVVKKYVLRKRVSKKRMPRPNVRPGHYTIGPTGLVNFERPWGARDGSTRQWEAHNVRSVFFPSVFINR